jgi:hypothetical protein
MLARAAMLSATLALAMAACGGAAPPRLGSPVVGGARMPEAWAARDRVAAARPERPAAARVVPRVTTPTPALTTAGTPIDPSVPLEPCTDAATTLCPALLPEGLDLSVLPRPHRATGRAEPGDPALWTDVREAADLRRLVGVRADGDSPAFARAAVTRLSGVSPPADLDELLDWADQRGGLAEPTAAIAAGDLLVFDHVDGGKPASLVAIAVAHQAGVTEMMYLAGGVVRRGFVDPARPRIGRDASRRVVNTFLRHGRDYPPRGTRYLAGELLSHVIRVRGGMASAREPWESRRAGQWRNW